MSRGVRLFPVGRRGARLIERQPAVRFPEPLSMPFKVANPRVVHGRETPAVLWLGRIAGVPCAPEGPVSGGSLKPGAS